MGKHSFGHFQQQSGALVAPEQLAPQQGATYFDPQEASGHVPVPDTEQGPNSWFRDGADLSAVMPAQAKNSTASQGPGDGAHLELGPDGKSRRSDPDTADTSGSSLGDFTWATEPQSPGKSAKVREAINNLKNPGAYLGAAMSAVRSERADKTAKVVAKVAAYAGVVTAAAAAAKFGYQAGHTLTEAANTVSTVPPTGSFSGLHSAVSDLVTTQPGNSANTMANALTDGGNRVADALNTPALGDNQPLPKYDQSTGEGTVWDMVGKAAKADGLHLSGSVQHDAVEQVLKLNHLTDSDATHLAQGTRLHMPTQKGFLTEIAESAKNHGGGVEVDPHATQLWDALQGSSTGANHGSDLAPHLRPSYPTTENGDTGPVLHSRHVTAEPTVGGPGAPGSSDLPEAILGVAGAAALVATGYIGRHRSQVREEERFFDQERYNDAGRRVKPPYAKTNPGEATVGNYGSVDEAMLDMGWFDRGDGRLMRITEQGAVPAFPRFGEEDPSARHDDDLAGGPMTSRLEATKVGSDGAVLRPQGPRHYGETPPVSSHETAPVAVAAPGEPNAAVSIPPSLRSRTTAPQGRLNAPQPPTPSTPATGRARRPDRRRGKVGQPNTAAELAALTTDRDGKNIVLDGNEPAPNAQASTPAPRPRRSVRQVVSEAFPRYQRQDRGLGQIQPNTAKDLEGLLREPRQRPPIGTVPADPRTPGSQPGENENNS
jgi:hypothetical protein